MGWLGRSASAIATLALVALIPSTAHADRAFTPRFSTNDTGNIAVAAAPLMACSTSITGTNNATCAASRLLDAANGPAGANTIDAQNNNNYTMIGVDTDGDSATTVNSSTATLTLPTGATVLFAGLYWGADQSAGNNGGAASPLTTPASQALFKTPRSAYRTVNATTIDFGAGTNNNRYQAFINVTADVAAAGSGTYAVGNVRAGTGGDRYAGWSLIVAYRDTTQPARNLTVFDGLTTIVSNAPATTIPVSGFTTPPAGPVRTTLGFVSYEGDLGLGGDTASLNTRTLANAANQATNFFNSSISANGVAVTTRDPAFRNTMGYDSDLFNADGVLANGATSATIGLTTNADQYLPGVITFATELYAPNVALAKTVTNVTHPAGPDQRGDVLRYTVTARNTGQDGADNFILTDPIPAGATYVPNSLRIDGAVVTDVDGDDRGEFAAGANRVVFRLGTGANATLGGRLAPGAAVPITFDVRIGSVQPRFEIVNAAAATYVTQSLRIPLTADSNVVTNVVAAPDITLSKRHSPDFVAGAVSTIRIVVSNVGNLPSDGSTITVTDPLPAAFTSFANPGGIGWSCAINARILTCTRSGTLADGDSFPPILVDVTLADPAPASIVNTATVAGGGDVNPDNNTATDVGGSAQAADLRITKTAAPSTVLSGQSVTFTLAVFNDGPSTAQAVTVSDPLGAAYSGVSATSTVGTCTAAVLCTLGDLARGESATITITATIAANATTLTNTARVSSLTPDPAPTNNEASANVVVVPTADVRLSKTPSTTTPTPGQANGLTYTIVATNAGPSTATGVVISDGVPADFTPTAITAPPGFTCSTVAATIVCSGGTIAAGSSATLTVTGTVAAAPASLTLVNAAEVRSDTADPDVSNNSDTATVQARPQADIGVTKVWGTLTDLFTPLSQTAADTDVRVLLSVTNFGPSAATGVVLRDALPTGSTYTSDDQAACAAVANVVTCNVGALASGSTFTVLVTVHVALGAAGTTLANTATGTATQPDPVDSNNSATSQLTVGTAADLVMQKAAAIAPRSVGDTINYTLTITNNGPSTAADVRVTDTLPAGLTFLSSPDCTAVGQAVTCVSGSLASGAVRTLTIATRIERAAAGTTVTNTATVSSTTRDPELANNTDAAAMVIAQESNLSITKRAAAPSVRPFQDITYTLTVANAGPNDATGVTVSDAVPAGFVFVSADPRCAFDAGTASVTCTIGDLANAASTDVTITLRPQAINAGTTVRNTATATGDQPDPSLGDNTDGADVDVEPEADLGIVKSVSAATVPAGGMVTYTLLVTNDGPSTAPAVVVDDPLPAAVTVVATSASQGTCAVTIAGVTCAFGALAAGASAQATITATVGADAGGTTLLNEAAVVGGIFDPRLQNNSSSVSTPVTALPAPQPSTAPVLSVTKVVDRTAATTANALTYRITVTNSGTAAASSVVVTDTFGGPVTIVSVTATAGTCTQTPLVCRIDSIAAGATVTITIVARATNPGTLGNGVTVTAANAPGGSTKAAGVNVTAARTSLSLRKRANRSRVTAGGSVRYALTVRNRGTRPALAVRVCDRLPVGLTLVSAPGATVRGRTACWTIPSLAGHASRTFTLNARTAASRVSARRIINRATAKGSNTPVTVGRATITVNRRAGGGVTG